VQASRRFSCRFLRAPGIVVGLVLLATNFAGQQVLASQYTPDDLYRYQYYKLPNGLEVYLKPRPGAHNVSIRVAAHVGTYDFPCGRKETPHFLEHLMFTGTSRHSESELDALIEDNGGSWNATTGGEKTIYEVNIYDQYASLALATLFEILTDSTFDKEEIEKTRDIVHREQGGRPGGFRRWLYERGIGRSAQDKADELLWPDNFNCRSLETADQVTRADILEAYAKYYVPNNMAIFVVGHFEQEPMLQQIQQGFGKLKPGRRPAEPEGTVPVPVRQRLTGTFSPILGTEARIKLNYQIEGYRSADVYPLILLNNYLSQQLFVELRVKRGLAYGPGSSLGLDRQVGVIALSSDAGLGRIEKVESVLLELVNKIIATPVSQDELDRIRRRVLLAYAQGYEDNDSIAAHYASVWRRYEANGKLFDLEQQLARVSVKRFNELMQTVLSPERVVIAVSSPTLSYHKMYMVIALLVAVLVSTILWSVLRRYNYSRGRNDPGN